MKPHLLAAVMAFSAVLLVPGSALANYSNQLEDGSHDDDNYGFSQQALASGPVDYSKDGDTETNLTALKDAHQELTEVMIDQNSSEDLTVPDIPFIYTYVAGDKLVVGLHYIAKLVGIEYTEQQIQDALGYDIPVVIEYGYIKLDSHVPSGLMNTYESLYPKLCNPIKSGYMASCKAMAKDMAQDGKLPASELGKYAKKTATPPPTTAVTPPSSKTTPCTVDPRSSECTYYKSYNRSCHYHDHSSCGILADRINQSGYDTKWLFSSPLPYDLKNFKSKLVGDSIEIAWKNPISYKYVKLYSIDTSNGKSSYLGQLPKGTASHAFDGMPGKSYKFYFKVYYNYQYPTGYAPNKYFDIMTPITIPLPTCGPPQILQENRCVDLPNCQPDEKLVELQCVDRCPASNERWNGVMCIVIYCQAGYEIKNNACVEKPKTKIVPPVVDPSQNNTKTKLMGGMEMFMNGAFINPFDKKEYRENNLDSTITLGVELKNGNTGILTAAHGVLHTAGNSFTKSIPHPEFYVKHNDTKYVFSNKIDKVSVFEDSVNSESGFIPVSNLMFLIPPNKILALNGTEFNVIHGNATQLQYGDSLHLYGKETNSKNGTLHFTDVTFTSTGTVFIDMMLGNYTSVGGDSGGPIIHMDNNTAKIVGMHKGVICTDYNTANPNFRGNSEHGFEYVAECPSNIKYKIFSPWENIVTFYDLK